MLTPSGTAMTTAMTEVGDAEHDRRGVDREDPGGEEVRRVLAQRRVGLGHQEDGDQDDEGDDDAARADGESLEHLVLATVVRGSQDLGDLGLGRHAALLVGTGWMGRRGRG